MFLHNAKKSPHKGPWKSELIELLKQLQNDLRTDFEHLGISCREILPKHMLQALEGGIQILVPLHVLCQGIFIDVGSDWILL
jgi:hypothetical protein